MRICAPRSSTNRPCDYEQQEACSPDITDRPRKWSRFLNLNSRTGSYRVRKAWKRGICDELVKPLIGIQRVEVPSGESLAGTPVASVAIHRVTGG